MTKNKKYNVDWFSTPELSSKGHIQWCASIQLTTDSPTCLPLLLVCLFLSLGPYLLVIYIVIRKHTHTNKTRV